MLLPLLARPFVVPRDSGVEEPRSLHSLPCVDGGAGAAETVVTGAVARLSPIDSLSDSSESLLSSTSSATESSVNGNVGTFAHLDVPSATSSLSASNVGDVVFSAPVDTLFDALTTVSLTRL